MSQNDVQLTLGLDTSPATAAMQQYYQQTAKGAQKAAAAQRPVSTALARLVKSARKVGIEYNSATKKFTDGSTKAALSIKEVTERIKRLNGDLEKTGREAKSALSGIGEGFKQVLQGIPQGIGLAIGQQLIAPLTNFGTVLKSAVGNSVKTFIDIDAALRQTASISGATTKQFEELQTAVIGLAKDTKFTTGELAEASIALARAGFTAQEVQEALPGIAEGAAAAGQTMDQMADTVIGAMGGFQKGTEETIDVVDVLTQTANMSNQSVTDLGEALKYVGPIANGLGLSLEDTSAALGLLANAGIRGSQAGTTLRSGLSRLAAAAAGNNSEFSSLSRGTGRLAKTLQMLGADVTNTEGNLKAFPELLKTLKASLGDLSANEQQLVSKILFGEEAAAGFRALLASTVEDIEGFADATNNATGVAKDTSEKNLAGIAGSLTFLSSAFDAASATVGKFLGTILKPLVDGLTLVLNAFNGLPEPIQQLIIGVTALTVAAGLAAAGLVLFNAAMNSGMVATFANSIAGAVGSLGIYATTLKTQVLTGLATAGTAAGKFAAFMTGTTVATVKNTVAVKAKAIQDALAAKAIDLKTAAIARYKAIQGGATVVSAGATKAAYGQTVAQTGVATSAKAAATGVKGFIAAAGPIAAIAVAVLAVGAAWDTYAQMAKGAKEATDALGTGNEELKEQLRALGAVVEETNKEKWEKSVESVGAVRAGLDRMVRAVSDTIPGLRLATGEQGKFNQTSNALAENLDKTVKNLEAGKEAYDKQVKRLMSLKKGSAEYVKQAKEIDKTEKVLINTTNGKIKALEELKKQLAARNAETEGEKQAQATAIALTQRSIDVLTKQKTALEGTAGAVKKLNEGIDELRPPEDVLKETSAKFKAQIKAMEQAFKNFKAELAKGVKAEVAIIKADIASLKSESDIFQSGKDAEIRAIKEVGTAANRTYQDTKQNIQRTSESKINAIQKESDAIRHQADIEITELERVGAATQARYDRAIDFQNRAHSNAMKNLDAQIRKINQQKDAVNSRYDAELDRLAELGPAEQQLAYLEEAKLRKTAQQNDEEGLRARAALERMEREMIAADLEKRRKEEIKALDEQAKRIAEEKRKKEEEHVEKMKKLEKEAAEAAKKNSEEIAAVKEEAAAKEEENEKRIEQIQTETTARIRQLEDENQQRKRDSADEIKRLEDEKRQDKEATAAREEELLKRIEEVEAQGMAAKEQAEQQYNQTKNDLLEQFNSAVGNTTDVIIREGEQAWSTYSANAVSELAKVEAAARRAAAAAKPSGNAPPGNWAGGPVSAGQIYTVNELGQEAFRAASGKTSLIDAPAFGHWKAPSKGTVINAADTEKLGLLNKGPTLSAGASIDQSGGVVAQRASNSEIRNLLRAISKATGGDNITNNVTIQADNTTRAASDMMVELTKIKRRRLR